MHLLNIPAATLPKLSTNSILKSENPETIEEVETKEY